MTQRNTAKRHQHHDQAVQWIMEGHSEAVVVHYLQQKPIALTLVQAKKLHGEAVLSIANTPDKGAGWHKRMLVDLAARCRESGDTRIELEAYRDLRKVEALSDGVKRETVVDFTKEGLLSLGADIIRRLDAGEIGVAKAQAAAQLIQSMSKLQDLDEEEIGDLGPRPEVAGVELESIVSDGIIDLGSWRGGDA